MQTDAWTVLQAGSESLFESSPVRHDEDPNTGRGFRKLPTTLCSCHLAFTTASDKTYRLVPCHYHSSSYNSKVIAYSVGVLGSLPWHLRSYARNPHESKALEPRRAPKQLERMQDRLPIAHNEQMVDKPAAHGQVDRFNG